MKLMEIHNKIITEIGDGSSRIFKYSSIPRFSEKELKQSKRAKQVKFKTDKGTEYIVILSVQHNFLKVDFAIKDEDFDYLSNKMEVFPVMNTITTIIFEAIEKNPSIKAIEFKASQNKNDFNSNDQRQRERLYLAFLEKKMKQLNREYRIDKDGQFYTINFK